MEHERQARFTAGSNIVSAAISIEEVWDGVSLTFAGIALGITATLAAVWVAGKAWWVLAIYTGSVLTVGYLALVPFRRTLIRATKRLVARS
jgi:hypothetical protein